MPMGMEDKFTSRNIVTNREPVGPTDAKSKGSVGDKALMDAIAIVVGAWIFLFFIGFSLRSHNV